MPSSVQINIVCGDLFSCSFSQSEIWNTLFIFFLSFNEFASTTVSCSLIFVVHIGESIMNFCIEVSCFRILHKVRCIRWITTDVLLNGSFFYFWNVILRVIAFSQPVENFSKEFAFSLPHDFMKFRHFELFSVCCNYTIFWYSHP